ncbi:hypothetical protein K493DRAFT_93841 [Basidiobolus meristosporus CBS 931.73]|uniref:Uncharacterized protein n=1 Tax=Basidiobolus meristosporus CBS 931.73 TaxID=1314790 RepID=A0A1Y1X730_9FUNG|nr:hypothetical protein K493DRAFT_93841 [Basidiobolus meristosporus CBS 931.73]|eukprot:ORX81571.1 hypothetical protein K493DRAFT_93841 [Basidiobolus meristosporus CBS 931.73]
MNHNGANVEATHAGDLGPDPALLNSFKAAATAVTQMYKDAMKQNRKSYQTGYEQCLQDLIGYISTHASVQSQRDRGDIQLRNSFIPASDLIAFTREKYTQIHAESTNSENPSLQRESHSTSGYQAAQPGVERHNVPVATPFPTNHQFNFTPPVVNLSPLQGAGFEGLHTEEFASLFGMDSLKRRLNASADPLFARDVNSEYMFEPSYKRGRPRHDDSISRSNKHFY